MLLPMIAKTMRWLTRLARNFKSIFFLASTALIAGCSMNAAVDNTSDKSSASESPTASPAAIAAPTGLSLITPSSSPGNNTSPVIQVSGLNSGDSVRLYTGVGCSSLLATATASATTHNFTLTSLSSGTYTFYAKRISNSQTSSCSIAMVQYILDTTAPSSPSGLALQSPSSSPGSDSTPTITVSGVVSGDTVKMFSDSSCSTQVASGTAAGTSIDLTSSTLSDGSYTFYANSTDAAGNISTCSSASVAYVLDTSVPAAPTGLSLNSPSSSPGNDSTPTITVSGVTNGSTVKLYSDLSCTFLVATGTASGTSIDLTSSTLTEAVFNFYATTTSVSNMTSSCSTATVAYQLDLTAPSSPSGLALQSPASSPDNDSTPTITVSGVASGDTVKMFSDSSCSTQVASGTAAGTSIDLTSSTLSDGSYTFYASSTDPAGNVSLCSTANVAYQYQSMVNLGAFSISGITGQTPDSTADNVLGKGSVPTVSWGSSTGASTYDVTVYANDGTTVVCSTQNTASTSYAFTTSDCGGSGLTAGSTYKVNVVAKASGAIDTSASNALYSFQVNQQPVISSTGPWYVLSGGSITLNLSTTSPHINASDADGDTLSVSAVGTPTFGSMSTTSSSVTFTPGSDTGVATVTIDVDDSRQGRTTATLTFKVVTAATWSGGGANSNWSTTANWCGAVNAGYTACTNAGPVPSSTTTAVFDDTCVSNCSANISANTSVGGVKISSGTITQGAGFTFTVNSNGGWVQTGGTFTGGTNTITMNGVFTMSGGSFSGGSGVNTFVGVFTLSGGSFSETSNTMNYNGPTFTIQNTPTYTSNNGTLAFSRSGNSISITPAAVEFGNVSFGGSGAFHDLNSGTIIINGTLTLKDGYNNPCAYGINSGTVLAKGNITVTHYGECGSATIKIGGSSNQTVDTSAATTPNFPNLEIASTGGTVSFVGTIKVNSDFTYTSGTVDWGSSTLTLAKKNGTATIRPGNLNYGNVSFNGWAGSFDLNGQTMKVTGLLTLADTYNNNTSGGIYNGTLEAYGNVSSSSYGYRGGNLKIVGSTNQTISGVDTNSYIPNNLEIASTGGTVTLSGTLTLAATTFSSVTYPVVLAYTSGTVDSGTSTVIAKSGTTTSLTTAGMEFYNFIIQGAATVTVNSTLVTNGTLTISGSGYSQIPISGSTLDIRGNLVVNGSNAVTNSVLFSGSTNATVTMSGSYPLRGATTVNKPGATLTLLANWSLPAASQDLDLTAGTIDMAGFNLSVSNSSGTDNVLTLGNGAVINKNGGTLSYESLIDLGGTINP